MRRRMREEEHGGELNVVPYLDVVVNLVVFVLLSMTGLVSFGVLNASAPRSGSDAARAAVESAPRLVLTVTVGRRGFHVGGAGGTSGPEAAGEPPRASTIPLRDGAHDYAALNARMRGIKEQFPGETAVILSAEPDVLYDVLIQTMDACRETTVEIAGGKRERRPLFYDVSLSLAG